MAKPKGGRGYKAPYVTKQTRIPEPIKTQVDQLIERYQDYLTTGGSPDEPPSLLDLDRSDDIENLRSEVKTLQKKLVQLMQSKDRQEKSFKQEKALQLIRHAVNPPNGTNKGETGYQAKSFSKGILEIREALALLEAAEKLT
jgi:hypothetical protein